MKKLTISFLTFLFVYGGAFCAYGFESSNPEQINVETMLAEHNPSKAQPREFNEESLSAFEWDKTKTNVSYEMQSYPTPPVVTVSSHVLQVGQDNQVTVTVTQNGLPLANNTIYVDSYPLSTDAYGRVSFTINPSYHGNITILAGQYMFENELLAVNTDEGVIEVVANDRSGNPLSDAAVFAASENMSWSSSDWGQTIRVIAKQGANELVYTKRGLDSPGYYLYRTVNVTAGQVNRFILEGSQTVAANVSFSYNSSAMQYTDVFFDFSGKDWLPNYSRRRVGTISTAGQQTVYITPGTYDIYFRGYSSSNQLLYLGQKANSFNMDSSTSFNWTDSDTGLLNVTTTFDFLSNFGGKQIALSGHFINLGKGSSVRMNPGTYSVEELLTVDNINTNFYFFEKDIFDTIIINSASTTNYDVDLSLNGIKFSNFGEVAEPGDTLRARVDSVSGYHMVWVYTTGPYSDLDVTITAPNGTNNSYSDDFYIYYQVPANASDGIYTMSVSGYFGPMYGSKSFSANFEVMSRPTVTVSPGIIPLGQAADVTFTVTRSDGTPLANTNVYLGEFQSELVGTTNLSGQLTITMQRETTTDVSFSVKGFFYQSLLFFIDVATEGVVEVTADDTNGNPISSFRISVLSNGLEWERSSNGGMAARAVAKAGQAQVVLAKPVYSEGVAYYLTKTVTITPGSFNAVHFNGSDSVPVTLSVNYLGSPMEDAYLLLKATGFTNEQFNSNYAEHYEMGLGYSSGSKAIRVTPGTYDAVVYQFVGSPLLYLKKNQLDLSSQTAVNINWDASNTSSVEIAPVTNQAEAECQMIILNDLFYVFNSINTIVISPGQHVIDYIAIYYDGYGYNFRLPAESGTTLNYASAGQTYSFAPDLRQAQTSLNLASSSVNPGGAAEFTLSEPVTSSGYLVESIFHQGEFLKDVDVSLKDPDGTVLVSTSVPYDSGSISTGASWPAGTYTLYAERYLGPILNTVTITASLYIGPPPVNYDANGDGQVSYSDLQEVSTHYSAESGDTGYQESSDLNGDGVVNLFDMVLVARQLTPPPQQPTPMSPPTSAVEPAIETTTGVETQEPQTETVSETSDNVVVHTDINIISTTTTTTN